jgi:rRNA maturation endonuclease Nob1
MNDVSENAIIAQMNKGIKDGIDESIETAFTDAINKGSVKSQEYQKLKSMYGKIKTVEDEVAKRALVEARKNAKGLSQTIIDSLAG